MSGNKKSQLLAMLLSLNIPMSVFAATHAIVFGGSAGFAYFPANLSVSVGDTIKWTGDFAQHPLVSTTIPSGALAWQNSSGTLFSYVVTVPGKFNYKCTIHAGMVGSFTATSLSVENLAQGPNKRGWNVRAVASSGRMYLLFNAPESGQVSIQAISLDGALVGTEQRAVAYTGSNLVPLQRIPVGGYILDITFNGERNLISRNLIR